ncbi:MAG: APC family permease [Rickettsiales bacterium]
MSQNQLTRKLGVLQLVVFYFTTVVGVGIFIVPLVAARIAGPASIISWLIAIGMAYPFAMIFAHISQKYQVSASIQRFIEDATSFKSGKSFALFLILTTMSGNFLLGYSAGRYVIELLGINDQLMIYPIAAALMGASCLFNLLNLGLSSKLQTVCLIVLVVIVELIVITAIPHANSENIIPFIPMGYESIFAAAAICFYSVTGWENVDAMAEETAHPVKTYRKAIKISLGIITVFYLSMVVTVISVLTPEQIKNSNAILSTLLSVSLGKEAAVAGSFVAIILLFLGANVWVMGTSRLIFSLGRDKILPGFLAKINPKSEVPANAVMIQFLVYSLIALLMYIHELVEDDIVGIVSLNYLLLYTIIFFCGVKSFTTKKLKLLALASLSVTAGFLIHSGTAKFGVTIFIALLCFCYVYIFKSKLSRELIGG